MIPVHVTLHGGVSFIYKEEICRMFFSAFLLTVNKGKYFLFAIKDS